MGRGVRPYPRAGGEVESDHRPEHRYDRLRSVDWRSMNFQVTVRYGGRRQRYHTYVVEADDARAALGAAADALPAEISADVDLVELRIAIDPDRRAYLGEEGS